MYDAMRKLGALLIALAMLVTWLNLFWIALAILGIIGIIDIILAIKKEDTISQWIHSLFPQWIDYIVMGIIGFYTWMIWGVEGFLPVFIGIIIGHLFWHED